MGQEGQTRAGLEGLTRHLFETDWHREDGVPLRIERCLIDTGDQTEVVHEFISRSPHRAIILGSKGVGIKAGNRPMTEYTIKPGETLGLHWLLSPIARGRRLLKIDTNFWKSHVEARLLTAHGDPGCLSLHGSTAEFPFDHAMFAAHCNAESKQQTAGRNRSLYEWTSKPGRPENHFWDCLVGSAVAASMLGCAVSAHKSTALGRRRKVKASEILAAKRAARNRQ
jgi:phage terminase large subunit GpA-like protein